MQPPAHRSAPNLVRQKTTAWPTLAQRRFNAAARFEANAEPSLDEMLNDPIFRRLLASDGLKVDHVARVIDSARKAVQAG